MENLFRQNKKPLEFFMPDGPDKPRITQKIQNFGGVMLKNPSLSCIYLFPLDTNTIIKSKTPLNFKFYSYYLVTDSVEKQSLVNLEDYRIHARVLSTGFGIEDTEKIRKVAKTQLGNPNTIKFWKKALDSGLSVKASPKQLKNYWVSTKGRSYTPKVPIKLSNHYLKSPIKKQKLQVKDEATQTLPAFKTIYDFEFPLMSELTQEFDSQRSLVVKVTGDTRYVIDLKSLEKQASSLNVIGNFECLLSKCSSLSGKQLEPAQVLEVLEANQGSVVGVLKHFLK